MIQVYVTEIPKKEEDCPFFNSSNKKCNITNDKCCLEKKETCEHLLDLRFEFGEL